MPAAQLPQQLGTIAIKGERVLKRLAFLIALLACAAAGNHSRAAAQTFSLSSTKNAVPSKPLILGNFFALDINCKLIPMNDVRLVYGPAHGKVLMANQRAAAAYRSSNPRSACNGRQYPAKTISYISEPNYTGADVVVVDSIDANGEMVRMRYNIIVR